MKTKALAVNKAPLPDIDIAALAPDEVELTKQAFPAIQNFIGTFVDFLKNAKANETKAVSTLATAKALATPTNSTQDEAVQAFIKQIAADKKQAIEDCAIGSWFDKAHKKITAVRARSTTKLDEAAQLGNDRHNAYVTNERRRAAEEQERVRQAAERKAQEDRDRELAKLEADRLKAEASSPDLSERERAFVAYCMEGATPERAASRAGYKDALRTGLRLVDTPKIEKAIEAQLRAREAARQAAAAASKPLDVQYAEVKADVTKAEGAKDRTTVSGEILDEAATIAAFLASTHGIPADLFQINPVMLNQYARSLGVKLNAWPGVRLKSTTRVI